MLPSELYQKKITAAEIQPDLKQEAVIELLDELSEKLTQKGPRLIGAVKNIFFGLPFVHGLYLWGGVGIGKTFLMDIFYQSLTIKKKTRIHFHQFMDNVHRDLNQYLGKKEPLKLVAKHISEKSRVLCFDEFYVKDITDAMVFVGLLKELFALDVCLVLTSNCEPGELYKNGLQRQNFLPAIKLLEKKLTVVHLDSAMDYRTQHLRQAGVYYSPLNKHAKKNMEKAFSLYAEGEILAEPINIFGRKIPIVKCANKIIWFDFDCLCGVPRSQRDYLALVKRFDIILISNIPVIKPEQRDYITCFIHLVDILYDAGIKLIASAEVSPENIYTDSKLDFEFGRTKSRLLEMQSLDYFIH